MAADGQCARTQASVAVNCGRRHERNTSTRGDAGRALASAVILHVVSAVIIVIVTLGRRRPAGGPTPVSGVR